MSIGIESLGVKLPSYAISAKEIAKLRNIPEEKITIGLGCHNIGLCLESESIVDLATCAAQRALDSWQGDIKDIELIAFGTESSMDESRPLSAWVANKLNIKGRVRSYEVKHACYGGTLALRQAIEWKSMHPESKKVALVIAGDICNYAPGHPAEPTQGAGAVAMIVGSNKLASVNLRSYPYSEPLFDFWRPTGHDFPHVDGAASLDAYLKAAENCFKMLLEEESLTLKDFKALCFHVPFPKMVAKAFHKVCENLNLTEDQYTSLLKNKVLPFMTWNQEVGNAYTASLWLAVSQALSQVEPNSKIACFSYGSGFGAEIFTIQNNLHSSDWVKFIKEDLENRTFISAEHYVEWQESRKRRRGI